MRDTQKRTLVHNRCGIARLQLASTTDCVRLVIAQHYVLTCLIACRGADAALAECVVLQVKLCGELISQMSAA
eukprot:scaffold115687_cov19-Prasinocladus_malaysianus.AAC.1